MVFKVFAFVVASIVAYVVWVKLVIPPEVAENMGLLPTELGELTSAAMKQSFVLILVALYIEAMRKRNSDNFYFEGLFPVNVFVLGVQGFIGLQTFHTLSEPKIWENVASMCLVVSAFYMVYLVITRLFAPLL